MISIEERVSKIESDLASIEAKEESDRVRIDHLEKQTEAINNLATSVAVMASKQDTMNNELVDLKTSIKAVENVPKKRYDALIGIIVSAVVGGIIGFLINLFLN